MIDDKDSGLGALLGRSSDSLGAPLPSPRKMAVRRLRDALKGDDDDAAIEALDDYLLLRQTESSD